MIFIKLCARGFDICMFSTVMSLVNNSLSRMKCPFVSLLNNVSLRSVLSDVWIVTPACFLVLFALANFFHSFTSKVVSICKHYMNFL